MMKINNTQGVTLLTAFARVGILIISLFVLSDVSIAHTTIVNKIDSTFDFTNWHVEDGAVTLNGDWEMHWQLSANA